MNHYKHQLDFLQKNPDKSALVWSCGTGKTRTAIEWARRNNNPTLIICPKPLKANWQEELKKWGFDKATVLTKEEFRKCHKELSPLKQVIVDEIHNGFLTPQFKSQMSKALRWYLTTYKVQRFLALSATVYSSSAWNIFNLGVYLGYNPDWKKFNDRFFTQVRMGNRYVPVQKIGVEKDIADIVKKIASVVDISDCLDVPEQNHTDPERFELSKRQIKTIKDTYDPLPIVRYTKQHQIEQGVLKEDDLSFKVDKDDRILDLVNENPKIAIVCRYNAQIDKYAELLDYFNPLIIRGDVKDRHSVTKEAEMSDRCVVLIQADCAEGYELPSFPICVFASMSYSYVKFEQICGRFLRMNKPSKTTFIYLLTQGDSIDKAVFDSIKRKEDFNIELYEKGRNTER